MIFSLLSQVPPPHQFCIENTQQAVTITILTLGSTGGAIGVAIKGFFDVQNARIIAELQGEIKRLEVENKHLVGDIEEEKAKNSELEEENRQLKTSGFSSQLAILEGKLSASEVKNKELMKRLEKAVNMINRVKGQKNG